MHLHDFVWKFNEKNNRFQTVQMTRRRSRTETQEKQQSTNGKRHEAIKSITYSPLMNSNLFRLINEALCFYLTFLFNQKSMNEDYFPRRIECVLESSNRLAKCLQTKAHIIFFGGAKTIEILRLIYFRWNVCYFWNSIFSIKINNFRFVSPVFAGDHNDRNTVVEMSLKAAIKSHRIDT